MTNYLFTISFAVYLTNQTIVLRPIAKDFGTCVYRTSTIGHPNGAAAVFVSSIVLLFAVTINLL